jgi:hypothetical protein
LPAPGACWLLLVAFDFTSAAVGATIARTGWFLIAVPCDLLHRPLHSSARVDLKIETSCLLHNALMSTFEGPAGRCDDRVQGGGGSANRLISGGPSLGQ